MAYVNSDINEEVDALPGLVIWFGRYSWKWTRALFKNGRIRIRYELICSLHKKSKVDTKLQGEKQFLLYKAPITWSLAPVHIKFQHVLAFNYSLIYGIMRAWTCLLNLSLLGCLSQEIRRWECKTEQNIEIWSQHERNTTDLGFFFLSFPLYGEDYKLVGDS